LFLAKLQNQNIQILDYSPGPDVFLSINKRLKKANVNATSAVHPLSDPEFVLQQIARLTGDFFRLI